jgi:hypothetical protein
MISGDPKEVNDHTHDVRVLGRAVDNVPGQQRPSHRLGDSSLKVDGHGEGTGELPESHLLPSLGGDRLQKQLSRWPRVEVGQESVDSRLSPSGQALAKVDKVADSVKVVGVGALLGTGTVVVREDVGEEGRVRDLLVGHELDQELVLGREACCLELLGGESGETVVEEIAEESASTSSCKVANVQLDPLLVQSQVERLEIKVGHGVVDLGQSVTFPMFARWRAQQTYRRGIVHPDSDTSIWDGSWDGGDMASEESANGEE